MALRLDSSAFQPGGTIPAKYTCQGKNISPPLEWDGLPDGTKSIALIVDDPSAPRQPFSHWVLYNIPPGLDHLEEDFFDHDRQQGGVHGRNDFGEARYGGPCPPRGPAHRYVFRLFALDVNLDLTPGADRDQLFDKMQGHILGQTELVGTYASA